MHVLFMFFAVFKNFKSLFSEDNMPVHALDLFKVNAAKIVCIKHTINNCGDVWNS